MRRKEEPYQDHDVLEQSSIRFQDQLLFSRWGEGTKFLLEQVEDFGGRQLIIDVRTTGFFDCATWRGCMVFIVRGTVVELIWADAGG